MKTITAEYIIEFLEKNDIKLKSTHSKLSLPIINRITKKMAHGIKFDAIKICDDLIIDGHHRYISSMLTNINLEKISSSKSSATKISIGMRCFLWMKNGIPKKKSRD